MSRDEVIDQFPSVKKKYLSYKDFADAAFNQVFSPEALKKSYQCHAGYFASSFIKNMGNGKFELMALPVEAQLLLVFGIYTGDL